MHDLLDDHRGMLSIAQYAEEILTAYSAPIAGERIEPLLYMTVGAGRLQTLNALTARMHKVLKIGRSQVVSGLYFEVVLGEFGSGKSHIGYMLKHNALTCGVELLVAHVQITGEARFPGILAAMLRSLRLAGQPSVLVNDIELSAYRRLFDWCGKDGVQVAEIARQAAGNLPPAAAHDFAQAVIDVSRPSPSPAMLQQFIDAWINRSDPKIALECFEMIFRMFNLLNSRRCLLVVDEFEAIQAMETHHRIQILQALQDFHDDFSGRKPGLPATHFVCFSTRDWWEQSSHILPSLMGLGQRVKLVTDLPDVDDTDIAALLYRYFGLYQLARHAGAPPSRAAIDQACNEILEEVSGTRYHMRSIHAKVREKVEDLLAI